MPGRRELPFPPLPYVVVYQVKGDTVESPHLPRRTGLALSLGLPIRPSPGQSHKG